MYLVGELLVADVTFSGSFEKRLNKLVKVDPSVKGYNVGFFKDSTYDDGTPIAKVAAWNEFGTKHIPERPFFRIANKKFEHEATKLIKKELTHTDNYVIDKERMAKIADIHVGKIQAEIIDLREPPNKPETIKAKRGKANPLIDTGDMRKAVSRKVVV